MQRLRVFLNEDGVSILYFTAEIVKELFHRLISDDVSLSYLIKSVVKGERVLLVK